MTVRPDLALLAVKTQDVATAVQDNLAALDGLPVLTCQNGERSNAIVAELLPPALILSAVVAMNAVYTPPGQVTITYPGTLLVPTT